MARLLGEARVSVLPDGTRFRPETEAVVKKAIAGITGKIPISPDLDKFRTTTSAEVKAALAGLNPKIKVSAYVDEATLAKVAAAKNAMATPVTAPLKVTTDPSDLAAKKAYLGMYFKEALSLDYAVDPTKTRRMKTFLNRWLYTNQYNTSPLALNYTVDPAKVATMKRLLEQYMSGNAQFGLSISPSQVAALKATLDNLNSQAQVGVSVDPSELALAEATLNRIKDVKVGVILDPAELRRIKTSIDSFMANNVLLGFSVDPAKLAIAKKQVMGEFSRTKITIPVDFGVVSGGKLIAMQKSFDALLNSNFVLGVNIAPAMAKMAAFAAYTKNLFSTSGSWFKLNVAPAIVQLLSLQAAITSVKNTFSQMGNNANVVAAVTAAATARTANAFITMGAGGGGALGFLTNKITLFAGVMDRVLPAALTRVAVWHVAADAILEFAAVFVPATIAVVAFGAAVAPVVSDAVNRLKAMQQAAAATGTSIGIFNYNAQGAVGPMQALQNKLQPVVWEVFGDAITVAAKKTGIFSTLVTQVGTVVEDLSARMTRAFSSNSMGNFLKNGALDFQRFGTIIGNFGGAIGNIIKQVPGYAEVFLQLFTKISAGIEWFTAIAGPVIKAGLALHGFFLYAGLATTAGVALLAGVGNMITKFFTFATAATSLTGVGARIATSFKAAGAAAAGFGKNLLLLATNPYIIGLAILGAAIYTIVSNWHAADAATSQFISNMENSLANMSGGSAIQAISMDLGSLTRQMKEAGSQQAFDSINKNWQNLGNTGSRLSTDMSLAGQHFKMAWQDITGSSTNPLKGMADAITNVGHALGNIFLGSSGFDQQSAVFAKMKDNINALETEFHKLTGEQQKLLTVAGDLMTNFKLGNTSTFTWAQSLGILDAAGVQASDSLDMMVTKVEGLLAGWKQFGLNATQIGNAVNAISLQTEMQQSSITTLTGAYSNFIGVVTGGESAFATFGQGMSTLSQALNSASAGSVTWSNSLGKLSTKGTAAGASLNGLSQASLNARGAFAQQVGSAQNLYNSLLTMSAVSAKGAQGQKDLASAGRDMVAMLLPLANGSKTATAEVYALAQTAGYQGADSFKALAKWVGGVKAPMQDLNKREQDLTVSSANLLKDTQNLAGAMGQTLTSAISGAIFAAEKGPQALQKLADAMQALQTGKGSVTGVEQALKSVIPALVQMTGSLPNARDQFLAMAGAMGIGHDKAIAMWNAVEQGKGALAGATGAIGSMRNAVTKIITDFNNQAKASANAKDALDKYNTAIKNNGVNSDQAKAARAALIADLIKAGVNAKTANSDVAAYSNAVKSNGVNSDQARSARLRLINDILTASNNSKTGKADLDALTSAVRNHSASSDQVRSARARLIADLEKTGTNSKTATSLVDGLISSIKKIPSSWSTSIKVSATGQWSITGVSAKVLAGFGGGSAANIQAIANQNARQVMGGAKGMFVTDGTTPTADDVLARVSKGELVVPANLVKRGAVDHLRGKIPGFAGGGYVGNPAQVGGFIDTEEKATDAADISATANALRAAIQSMLKSAIAAASAMNVPNVGSGVARWKGTVDQALRMLGLSTSLDRQVLYQMQTESGGNPNAINLSDSNAAAGDPSRGLMQTIMATFKAYHVAGTSSNIYDPLANIAAAINYARSRYGPTLMSGGMGMGSGHGYALGGLIPSKVFDRGGTLAPGPNMVYNLTGRPEHVVPTDGSQTITLEIAGGDSDLEQLLVQVIRRYARIKSGGNVQRAFGRN
jgi:hypothetical protein